ncbi:UvrD-helicase domain-containing protein [Legionella spiritensis]|uniref:DNA 3'-5' helicase n=1 Tax=Legionella spiritensis TaxID=452 RepID=A0A0W0YX89_LEGSP|nr:UvrD-helicase domain-containing protein [Legionella spiritensis]KTD61451.1 ATP-dependent DNA helicase [Legionella spiritensis]SNV33862.1 ATP-dependent DNA helicase (UvrD/Rep helicase) [Legionella spiritensis]
MLKDGQQRSLATDPTRSFIVQAPAGSGKTELLTQRFLRLLGSVQAPQQIVALTFTRKAASEMRERILASLNKAAQGIRPETPHQQLTFQLASDALKRDRHFGWQLLEQPHCLRIMTIDSLCQTLTRAIPLPEKQLPYCDITDLPYPQYIQAAQNCVACALDEETYRSEILTLLQHLDNRQDRLLELFSNLLQTRDQWLETFYQARDLEKETHEQALALIEQHGLRRLIASIPSDLRTPLCHFGREMASLENDPQSIRFPLRNWHAFEPLDREIASALADLLLTKQGQLRKRLDSLKKGVCDPALFQQLKDQGKELLTALQDCPDVADALLRVSKMPEPHYDNEQWQVLQSLLTLLPVLVAHLHLVFKDANVSDFTAISQQAILALGDEEQPTDLTLYLDNTIHHLLVDEFQDTSLQQASLIEKLVQGWQPDDGKTLFLVGDPMQSIYRFRQAEVGLFLKARQQGIGHVRLTPLELCCNFRSSATLVDWVNSSFQTIFPGQDDIESGAISFHSSAPAHQAMPDSGIYARQLGDREREARAVVDLVADELATYPEDQIAILVRSRSHLNEIVRLLRTENIAFQGVEIEQLSSLPHIRDIWSLTKALLYPADRLAWMALIRSPWCGLSLTDLHKIANFDRSQSILHALQSQADILDPGDESTIRLRYFTQVMSDALTMRQQQSLVDWVRQTAGQLHSEYILDAGRQTDLEQFWRLLDQHSQDGQIADIARFTDALDHLYSQCVTPSRLQIMTIHKSKGLEFDSVILPGLGNRPPNRDLPLLRWLRLPSQTRQEYLLISPIRASYKKQCLLYDYLGELEAEKERYELQRLLYVATTRAKKRLHLFDNREKGSGKSTFRALLHDQMFQTQDDESQEKTIPDPLPTLWRLPVDFYKSSPPRVAHESNHTHLPDLRSNARQTGIITHELMQWICTYHPTGIDELPWSMITGQLKGIGLDRQQLEDTLNHLKLQMNKLFQDPIGQWICNKHSEEHNEYELLVEENGRTGIRIIDRTFCDQGICWIIDFKTGREDDQSQQQHKNQVNGYARLLTATSTHPIHCGLYYLNTNTWINWPFQD